MDPLHGRPVKAPAPNALTLLTRRLEAATSRLEDIASSATGHDEADGAKGLSSSSSAPELPSLSKSVQPSAAPAAPPLPRTVQEMDEMMEQELASFVTASKSLDGPLADQVYLPLLWTWN